MERQAPGHNITNYVGVPSVDALRQKSRNSAAESAWKRRPCQRWATLSFAKTRRVTCLLSGNGTIRRNSCPEGNRSFVVGLKTEAKSTETKI